ncbi:MAG: hypothetical protein EBX70_03830 [Betaproteobacteria bacterium]|nr:hypothetical protein [Betaproteobacteria bacterium]
MLGQQALIELHELKASDKDLALLEKSLSQLPQRLRGRFWGSLHDRVSGPVRMPSSEFKRYVHQPLSHRSPRAQPNAQLVRWLSEVEALQAHGEWLDHLTSGVFHADNPRVYLLWPFAPQYWHWLEMAWVKPSTDTLG